MSKPTQFAVAACVGVLCLLQQAAAQDTPLQLHVATNGNDSWSGKLAAPDSAGANGPFASLERARDEVRKLKAAGLPKGGVEVVVHGGVYHLAKPFELTADDSGTNEAPIIYRAASGEEVRLVGGKAVTDWKPVTDAAVVKRLDESAKGKVFQADLKALGISDFGAPDGGGMEVFFGDKPMTLSRWPNEGFVRIVDLVEKDEHKIHGISGSKVGKFFYDGDRPKRWIGEKEAWLHGYWFWDWSDQRQKIESIDAEKSILSVVPPYHGYGYRKGQWYYAFNLLPELDSPGEWYVDREAGILYFWPPAAIDSAKTVVTVIPTLVAMNKASNVTLRGFLLEGCRGTALTMSDGNDNRVIGCTVRNVGGGAISVSGGARDGVIGCDIYDTGGAGIGLTGGNRTTLVPAGHFADNNHIHHYGRWNRMYQSAIQLAGVGNRATHNLIHDAPHMAIGFGGNDHVVEFNEIHDVCYESNDAGAMYAGRDWTMRGTIVRHNYLHHINGFEGRGCVGVYLDDMYCGTQIYGNVFYKVTSAAFIGGGRDCTVENNIFVDCSPALHIDARALGWAYETGDNWIKENQEKGTVSGIAYNKPPYSEKYPQLITLMNDEPKVPKGNVIARNVCRGGKWEDIEAVARPLVTLKDNLINEDPLFVDESKQDFRLKDESPAFKLGFKPIPIEKIGLYKDDARASWPVTHPIREASSATK